MAKPQVKPDPFYTGDYEQNDSDTYDELDDHDMKPAKKVKKEPKKSTKKEVTASPDNKLKRPRGSGS